MALNCGCSSFEWLNSFPSFTKLDLVGWQLYNNLPEKYTGSTFKSLRKQVNIFSHRYESMNFQRTEARWKTDQPSLVC